MDFTAIISVITVGNIVAAILAVSMLYLTVDFARWGYDMVISMFEPDPNDPNDERNYDAPKDGRR